MSGNTMQKALMRKGDFHLRHDARQLYGNYVELSPAGGGGAFENNRRSAMVVATPVFDEPREWQIEILFGAPKGIAPGVVAVPLSPWVPEGFNFDVFVTITAALDRDKAVFVERLHLRPLNFPANGSHQFTFPVRFQNAVQLSVAVEVVGGSPIGPADEQVIGVQASAWPVTAAERDAFGTAQITLFPQLAINTVFLTPNALRRQFIVQNFGTTPLYVAFSNDAVGPGGGGPSWTIALMNKGDAYESGRDTWLGYVSGIWDAGSAGPADGAMVTEET